MSAEQCLNTDRELWREPPGDYYANSIHLTETGGIGINVGGMVRVQLLAEWHKQADELTRLRAEVESLTTRLKSAEDGLRNMGRDFLDETQAARKAEAQVESLRHKLNEWETPMTCGHPRALIAVEEEYHCYACQVVEPLRQENESLRAALLKYGQHHRYCNEIQNGVSACNCGFDRVMEKAE